MLSILRRIKLKLKYKDCIINTEQIHPNVFLGKGVNLSKNVSLGKDVSVNDFTYINNYTLVSSAKIGKYCSIGPFCNIGPDSHPINWISSSPIFYKNFTDNGVSGYEEPKDKPIIGNDVWIGSHVVVLRGVKIGNGAVLAAGSVVTKDVLPYSIVGGVPAKHLKYRFKEKELEAIVEKNIWNENFPDKIMKELGDKKQSFLDYL